MPHSIAEIFVHLVFSTKNRLPLLTDDLRESLHRFIGGIIENRGGALLKIGSVEDHIHLLISMPRTMAPSDLVRDIKVGSSMWLKEQSSKLSNFFWQAGYGMFSISPAHRPALEHYIANQADHHKQITFKDEFRQLLERYGVVIDERYLWD